MSWNLTLFIHGFLFDERLIFYHEFIQTFETSSVTNVKLFYFRPHLIHLWDLKIKL
jgi:hypothetical protein